MKRNEDSGARLLISNELAVARRQLRECNEERQQVEQRLGEITSTATRLKAKILQLEQDEKALSRGYIALMGDAAQVAEVVRAARGTSMK